MSDCERIFENRLTFVLFVSKSRVSFLAHGVHYSENIGEEAVAIITGQIGLCKLLVKKI